MKLKLTLKERIKGEVEIPEEFDAIQKMFRRLELYQQAQVEWIKCVKSGDFPGALEMLKLADEIISEK